MAWAWAGSNHCPVRTRRTNRASERCRFERSQLSPNLGRRELRSSSVTEILTEPVSAMNVWRGDELADAGRWLIGFSEDDFADFERALAHVSRKQIDDVTEIGAEDFPLHHFRERIDDIVDRLEHGLGFVLLRGLPVYDRFSEDDAAIVFWGIGRHVGNLVPQNRKGDLLGHIRDLGRRGPYERAYATNEDLGFHTDSTDFVGLMCLRRALRGGESFVASSGLLYNFVLDEHPEYLPILHKNFPTDWRSEEPPGSPGWYLEPLYSYFGGVLSATEVAVQRLQVPAGRSWRFLTAPVGREVLV